MLHEYIAVGIYHFNHTVFRNFKRSRMRTVLFRFLCHEPNIGYITHCCHIELSVLDTIIDHLFIENPIRFIRNNSNTFKCITVSVPLLAAFSDNNRHGSIDDHIVRRIEVCCSLVRIDHSDFRTVCIHDCLECRFDLSLFFMPCNLFLKICHTEVGVDTKLFEEVCIFRKYIFKEDFKRVTEHNRVRDFHHRCFEVNRPDDTLFFCLIDCFSDESSQCFDRHKCTIENFTVKCINRLQFFSVKKNFYFLCLIHCHRLFMCIKITIAIHVGNIGFRIFSKRLESVRMLLRILFNRFGCTSVRVSFSKHRVYCRTETNAVFCLDLFLFGSLRVFRVVWNVKALFLKFSDTLFELSD